ncbi:MAG: (2Fe-2S)-binding domain protein [Conexibacter sp.]|jgi:aerobic-type carbon monoxide dehydrogenase small subunit (CoxS/CutS family)|nr:(2Fe-2S)-binding domain protein [Conexibacter sp.]
MPDSVHAIELTVNGEPHEAVVPGRQLLVHFIRDTLGLRGTHIGCDSGNCGACTVIVDGKAVKSCMQLAVQADGRALETVEGLSGPGEEPNDLQAAFTRHHALQCGYCTPGMLMSATALLEQAEELSLDEIRRGLKGNICRCTGYVNIVRAVEDVAARRGLA